MHYFTDTDHQARIKQLEHTVELLKKQIAEEVSEKYAAYQRIVELKEQLEHKHTV
jgi:hypothetical protein